MGWLISNNAVCGGYQQLKHPSLKPVSTLPLTFADLVSSPAAMEWIIRCLYVQAVSHSLARHRSLKRLNYCVHIGDKWHRTGTQVNEV